MFAPRSAAVKTVAYLLCVASSLGVIQLGRGRDTPVRASERPTIIDALSVPFDPGADGYYVTVRPPLGTYGRPLRAYVTRQELQIARRLESIAASPANGPFPTEADVHWHVEESALLSPTLIRQERVWHSLQWSIERYAQVRQSWRIDVIVGRTQEFIHRQLIELDCSPDLSAFSGQVLMGATLCNRRVIVINVTGFLFLHRSSQHLTPSLEAAAEPPLSSQPYQIVERNNLGLAHEWVHVLRSAIIGSVVREGDPIWFREGYANVLSLLARSRAPRMQIDYVYAHIMALRYDPRQLAYCPGSLARYRTTSSMVHGCSYILGGLALEYLLSYYGGVPRLMTMFRLTNNGGTFAEAFAHIYGISLPQFEARADVFIQSVRKAARR